jgi:hypothetical protein
VNKKWLTALVVTGAVLCGLAALAAGGSASDPLISLGYLTGTYSPQILGQAESQMEDKLAGDYQKAADDLQKKQSAYLAGIGEVEDGWSYSELFQRQAYKRGDTVTIPAGSGFYMMAGAASVGAEGGEVVDVTAGTSSAAIASLAAGHRYLAAEGATVTVTILSDAAYLAPQGYYQGQLSTWETLPFLDIQSTDWYYEYVHYVCSAGLFLGTEADRFSPNLSMTRGMLATVLYRLAGSPGLDGQGGEQFADVPADAWYSEPVAWASSTGVVKGLGDGNYGPNDLVTREQMALMLYRYASSYAGISVELQGDIDGFSDGAATSSWAREALSWAVGAGIISGKDGGRLDPVGTASRAEVAAMLQRFSKLLS